MKYLINIYLLFLCSIARADMLPMDAIVFKNMDPSIQEIGRIDLLAAIPYQILTFKEQGSYYSSDFQVVIQIMNLEGDKVKEDNLFLNATAKDYFNAQGGNGGFYTLVKRYPINSGIYTIEMSLQDEGGKIISFAKKQVSVVDFDEYNQTLSGLMLISEVEEINGKQKITPQLSDNIFDLDNGFSVFFQVYSNDNMNAYIDWEIIDLEGEIVKSGDLGQVELQKGAQEQRIFISSDTDMPMKELVMRVYLRKSGTGGDVIAAADRTLNNVPATGAEFLADIDEAISMLAYVADASLIDSIENLGDDNQKRKAFLEFWDSIDPSPNTRKNEAFEEYFTRIEYANQNYSTYATGWLTDMGRVYIVLGQPQDIAQSTGMNTRIQQEIWVYSNLGRFVFQDRSGFGDYRLVQPMGFRRKYEYGNNTGR